MRELLLRLQLSVVEAHKFVGEVALTQKLGDATRGVDVGKWTWHRFSP
jgi:hypothetical protein